MLCTNDGRGATVKLQEQLKRQSEVLANEGGLEAASDLLWSLQQYCFFPLDRPDTPLAALVAVTATPQDLRYQSFLLFPFPSLRAL
ncbi:hypothetical protein LMH87_005043 [Akanthomyces muscarius]|uniref:Uncharacterized protein n=1 Tax=Akanthomyces muscarius TaxID=2231603 RepID=A0A9W8QKK9_AKAMU|nr:hypothetical protein LMH87_005043 [Akanthomyces muscarius]KAJ4163304.1 hypothetical protein LMH87_005043 [Akanthomyces muscarius]